MNKADHSLPAALNTDSGDTPAKQPWQTPLLITQDLPGTNAGSGHHYDFGQGSFSLSTSYVSSGS